MLPTRIGLLEQNISYIFLVPRYPGVPGVDCLERKGEVRQGYFVRLILKEFYMSEVCRAEVVRGQDLQQRD